jgi:hypothetical protein
MSDQVQCPNCGGYKVQVETKIVDRSSGKQVAETGCVGWAIILLLLGGALGYMLQGGGGSLQSIVVGMAGMFLVILLVRLAVRSNAEARKADKIEKYDYVCSLCGYKWSRREDEPIPPVEVRPDLIAKGAQKLEEEQKRRDEEHRNAGMWMDKK